MRRKCCYKRHATHIALQSFVIQKAFRAGSIFMYLKVLFRENVCYRKVYKRMKSYIVAERACTLYLFVGG